MAGICRRLADCIADRRDPARLIHCLDDTLRARVFAIACGYEDGAGQVAGIGLGSRQPTDDEPLGECADHT